MGVSPRSGALEQAHKERQTKILRTDDTLKLSEDGFSEQAPQTQEVVILKKQYPMGSEKHLIYCTTGRKVPVGKMPFDVGCCVQNIKTINI